MKSTKQFKPAALFQNAKTIVSILLLGMAVFVSQGAWALGGSGTKAYPYTISSEADLREFADIVNGTNAKTLNANAFGVLTGDITLTRTWTPMGSSANPYTGTFDGQGHAISGLSGSQGLFAYTSSKTISGVAYDATIKSFTLKGSISSAADNTGSVVGAAYGATKIYDVYSSVDITMTAAKSHIGGVAGGVFRAAGQVPEIKGCSYSGTMTLGGCSDSNGGIVGYCEKDANVQIEYCLFNGVITTSASNPRVGGIMGYAYDPEGKNFNYLRNCFVAGSFKKANGDNLTGTYVAAIAGYPNGSNVVNAITDNTFVTADGVPNKVVGDNKTAPATNKAITIDVTAEVFEGMTCGTITQSYVNPTTTTAPQLQVEVSPNFGFYFLKWKSGSTSKKLVLPLTDNISQEASFGTNKYSVEIKPNLAGYGKVKFLWSTFFQDYERHNANYLEQIGIHAAPNSGYHFLNWDNGSTENPQYLTVNGTAVYTAIFAPHTFGEWVVEKEATCKSAGSRYRVCTHKACGVKETEEIPADHSYTDKVATSAYLMSAATCSEDAVYYYKCRTCDIKGTATWTKAGSALGHDMTAHDAVQATCTDNGNYAYWTCSRSKCEGKYFTNAAGTEFATSIPVIPADHNYIEKVDDAYLLRKANCTEPAMYYLSCSMCGKPKYITVDNKFTYGEPLGHDYAAEYTIDKQPACTAAGSKSKHCSRCSSKIDKQDIAALGHGTAGYTPFYSWGGTHDAATFSYGLQCIKCRTYMVDREVLTPTIVAGSHTDATCTENGNETWKVAAISYHNDGDADFYCEEQTHDYAIPAFGHTFSDFDIHGFAECSVCHAEDYEVPEKIGDVYHIDNAGQLYYYARLVNSNTDTYFYAKLVKDIVINDGTFDADGNFTPAGSSTTSTPRSWTPIGRYKHSDGMKFDGNGHTISGLYLNDANKDFVGFVGDCCGYVKNLGLINCYFKGQSVVGGILGTPSNIGMNITNCYVTGRISGLRHVGGICGVAIYNSTVSKCWSDCVVSAVEGYCGSISGYNVLGGIVEDCYSMGTVTSQTAYAGGISGGNVISKAQTPGYGTIRNCYSTAIVNGTTAGSICGLNDENCTISNSFSNNATLPAIGQNDGTAYLCESNVSAERLASGEIAYKLNGSVDDEGNWSAGVNDGTQAWYQKLGEDACPVLTAADGNTLDGYTNCISLTFYTNDGPKEDGAHDFSSHTLTAAADENGLYQYVCDNAEGHLSAFHVIKDFNGEGKNLELTGDSESGYSASEDITLAEGTPCASPVDFTAASMTLNRSMAKDGGMYSFVVPFDIAADKAAEMGTFYKYSKHVGGKVYFDDITKVGDGTVKANTAYFFEPAKDITSITAENAMVKATASMADAENPAEPGIYATYTLIEMPAGAYTFSAEDALVKAGAGEKLSPWHAYLWLGGGEGAPKGVGDINGDGSINIADLTLLIEVLNGRAADMAGKADVDKKDGVNINDVNTLKDIILGAIIVEGTTGTTATRTETPTGFCIGSPL